jgi:XTP/dITP diphosphohydrolase
MRLLLGTTNAGKIRELRTMLASPGLELISLCELPAAPEVEEDGDTYLENALKKATTWARWSGVPTLADDSGLEVDVLGGVPGVKSARYAGPQQDAVANRRKLLQALEGVAEAERSARFVCVIVVARTDGATLQATGSCEGRIATQEQGYGGFGYDPIFFYAPAGCTLAQMEEGAKNEVSHRGRAAAALRDRLDAFLRATEG